MPRILTYNVHRCLGTDRRLDVARIAAVIADCEPDVVCLQELDVGRTRSGGVDQAREIARRLSMRVHFNAAMRMETEEYGDAILTVRPERLVRAAALPTLAGVPGLETRGALWAEIDFDGTALQVLNTHLGLVPREQRLQALALVGDQWLNNPACLGPTILTGDFNVTSMAKGYSTLARRLPDAQRRLGLRPSVKTFPSTFPAIRIDHFFISDEVRPIRIHAPSSSLARVASDHLPLVMDFALA